MPDIEAAVETPEVTQEATLTEEQEMDAAYERAMSSDEPVELAAPQDGLKHDEPEGGDDRDLPDRDEQGRFKAKEPPETIEGDEEAPAEQEAVVEPAERPPFFNSLPQALRENWDDLKPEVRQSVLESHTRMAKKAMEAGRLLQGLGPIQSVMQKAVSEFPELSRMTPEQVAADAMELAKTRVQLQRDPVGTLLAVAQQTGALEGLRARLSAVGEGQPQVPAPPQQPQPMPQPQGSHEALTPDIIRGTVAQVVQEQALVNDVDRWAGGKEHYQTVEPHLPQFIQMAQGLAEPGASPLDILDSAYEMATRSLGLRASQPRVAEAIDDAAPQRSEAALRAKSVNVKSRGTRPSSLTEEQEMGAAWERAMRK